MGVEGGGGEGVEGRGPLGRGGREEEGRRWWWWWAKVIVL